LNYDQAIEYLQDLGNFGINLGMARIKSLLELMGNPERELKCIHIAGTNGKGSTSMLLAAVLQAAGYRVGVYTSPHLQSYEERFMVNGHSISEQDFASLLSGIQPHVDQVAAAIGEHPTQFEVLTAIAYDYFRAQQVDYVVLEVGLGGTLDSTNTITPLLSVITNISFDHMDRLGTTIAAIATNKAGIIKEGVPVVTAATGEALDIIEQAAAAKNSVAVNVLREYSWELISATPRGQIFDIQTPHRKYEKVNIGLLGPHQLENCAITLATVEQLSEMGLLIGESALYQGFAAAQWPGRFEIVSESPVIILDGAHNPSGAAALHSTLKTVFPDVETVLVVGILADKDYRMMLREFSAAAELIILTTADSPRAADPQKIAAEISDCEVTVIPDLTEAVAAGIRQAGMGKVVCICGSLYTVGKAREILMGNG